MRTLQQLLAILCVTLMMAPLAAAQDFNWQAPHGNRLTGPYTPKQIDPINLTNSNRLEQLLRAGKLYLSLQDTIALALENSLDVELSRYGPQIAQADLLRAQAGGLLRGVPQSVDTGSESATEQAIGSQTGGQTRVSSNTGAATTATEAGGAVITQTGVATPNLDPSAFTRYGWGHRTSINSNTITTGSNSTEFDTHSWNFGYEQNWLTGTGVSLGWNNNHIASNNKLNALNPSFTSNWQVRITQRLLQGFGRAVNGRNIKIANNNVRVSDLVFKQQVIATVSSVIKLYWDLVAFAEDVGVKQKALGLAEKLYNDNKKQVEIGTLAPIEISVAEAQVARRQQELTSSETRLLQQETIIKNALSRTGVFSPSLAEARVVPTDRLPVPDAAETLEIVSLVDTAMANRPEIEQTQINMQNTNIGMEGSRSQLKPSLDALVYYNHNGLAGDVNALSPPGLANPDPFVVGGYGTVLGQLFRRNFPDYGFGVSLNIPLRNRSAQADYIRDALQLRQQEIRERQLHNNIRVQVENAKIAVTQAMALYDAAFKERQLQEQTLAAEQKKYALGASTVFFVIQYQRDLAAAQSTEVASLAAYAKAKVELQQAVGQTLQAYNVAIDEARIGQVSRPPTPVSVQN